jgi:hypothetical protein
MPADGTLKNCETPRQTIEIESICLSVFANLTYKMDSNITQQ